MDNLTQDLQVTADTAEAEKKEAAAGLGKFKDVEALMQAYTALEAEFTRRSQKLKELEKTNKELSASPTEAGNGAALSSEASNLPQSADGTANKEQTLSDEIKNAVIEEYLNGVCGGRSVPIIAGGSGVPAQVRVPRNITEAGALAQNYFNNKETLN